MLLATSAELMVDDELIRVANNWAVIQAYYSVYHATQALHVARGCSRPESHPATRKLYRSHWVDRRVDLPPWTIGVANRQVVNPPAGRTIDFETSNLANPTPGTQLGLVCKALQTTWSRAVGERMAEKRQRKLSERAKQVRAENERRQNAGRLPKALPQRANLTADERRRIADNEPPASLMDYLWRLRIKANYQDGEMFIVGPTDGYTSGDVLDALRYLVAATLLIHELNVGELIGLGRFYDWHEEWLRRTGQRDSTLGLAGRSCLFEPF